MIMIVTVFLGVIAYISNKLIRKGYGLLIFISLILAVVSMTYDTVVTEMIIGGYIGLAFYIIVMLGGAFPRQSKISKRLRSVRKEYSIIGFVLLLPHVVEYLISFIHRSYPVEWFGIVAFLIMIPLFITSFERIKRRMNIKKWKKLQKFAYWIYVFTFLHLIIVSEGANQISYIVIFSFYVFLKVKNYLFINRTSTFATVQAMLIAVVLGGLNYMMFRGDTLSAITHSSNGINYMNVEIDDGVYSGSAIGFQSLETKVTVTIEHGEIVSITFLEIGATAPHHGTNYEAAAYEIANDVLYTQSTDIDSISGATKTTDSVLDAIDDALEGAFTDHSE